MLQEKLSGVTNKKACLIKQAFLFILSRPKIS